MAGTVLDAIGNTPIAELRQVVPPGCARIVVKLEWGNPTGSMKDRMARAAIEAAERDGGARQRAQDGDRDRDLGAQMRHRMGQGAVDAADPAGFAVLPQPALRPLRPPAT